jgi:hypothetical protein
MTRRRIGGLLVILIALLSAPLTAEAQCRLNSDCPIGDVCTSGSCVAAPPCTADHCPCTADAMCGARELCDFASGQCVAAQCVRDLDCPLSYVCGRGKCLVDVDADRDRDGVPDAVDNCPNDVNPGQDDQDRDGAGDACDPDLDNDGLSNVDDNCPRDANAGQWDRNSDGVGDACEPDFDYDGVPDDIDNCTVSFVNSYNPDQSDSDGDGLGDPCDLDRVRPPKRRRIDIPLEVPPLPSIQNILPRAAEEDDGDERRNVPLPPRDELLLPPVLRR